MIFGSVCSGIEAASVAWHPLGWKAAWLAEIEPFPSAVLAHHYPDTPNLGDMTKISAKVLTGDVVAPDVLVGGTPCQAFSVAGLREGLNDGRGQLTIKYMELANAIDFIRQRRGEDPAIIVWENVPGVLSDKTNAFGCFLAGLAGESVELKPAGGKWSNAGCVFGPQRTVAWRVLDAQYFGVAQRRRRVFVVASARKGFDPASVLFEWDGVRRDSAPSRETGEEIAATLDARAQGGGFPGSDGACGGHVQAVASTLDASYGRLQGCSGQDANYGDPVHPLAAGAHAPSVAYSTKLHNTSSNQAGKIYKEYTVGLDVNSPPPALLTAMQVRRLIPQECELLQGFPRGYTQISWRKKPAADCPDGLRYKALGNSMAVPCMFFIGSRINAAVSTSKAAKKVCA